MQPADTPAPPLAIPAAAGSRRSWSELPERIRAAIETRLGSRVVSATSQPGGFSPGAAVRLRTANGRRAFVKAAGPEPNLLAPVLHRREARIAAALPAEAPVPRLLWSDDESGDGWVVLAFEDVEGRHPATPWREEELSRVLAALADLSAALTPSPLPPGSVASAAAWGVIAGGWWQRVRDEQPIHLDPWSSRHLAALSDLEMAAPAAVAGDTLLHLDLRADNLLLTPDQVLVVDWPHARVGAPWVDVAFFAPSVAMQGGPHPDELLASCAIGRSATADEVTAVVAAIAGFFTREALRPAPPGLPTLRAFQSAQGAVARGWLAGRTGWR
jgi:aminoglycoside phosphotransferase (APT) family kinase protein